MLATAGIALLVAVGTGTAPTQQLTATATGPPGGPIVRRPIVSGVDGGVVPMVPPPSLPLPPLPPLAVTEPGPPAIPVGLVGAGPTMSYVGGIPFAVRTGRTDALDPTNPMHAAFAADRDPQGRLTDQSLDMLDDIARRQLRDQLAIVGGVTPNSVTPAEVQQIMASNTNQVTGRTIYPELTSYLDTMGSQPTLTTEESSLATTGDREVVTRTIDGTRLTVHWDRTDSRRDQRLASLSQAIELVQRQGFVVPPLTAYLPKYGRNLIVAPGQVREGNAKIQRAEYVPPDALVASPELLDNPLAIRYGGAYHNLSTQLDPSGVGTMVHELGHFLHYHQNRGMFHDLTATSFAAGKADVAATVSGYAGQKPREFVAEVFLGLAYGRTFSADVMEMYDGLGGPTP